MDILQEIRLRAEEVGFDACGFTPLSSYEEEKTILTDWLSKGYASDMQYMHNNLDKRFNPTLLLNGARGMIVVLMSYFPETKQPDDAPKIATYAYSADYHYVIKEKLRNIAAYIETLVPESSNVCFCDSAPVMERTWAVKAGLGWIGKSGMFINPKLGSYTFIGTIITTLELPVAEQIKSKCGNCSACVDACLTGAIKGHGIVDANRCVSYHTIENRMDIPADLEVMFGRRLFGCDTCMEYCPWNIHLKSMNHKELTPIEDLFSTDWRNFSRSDFKRLFKKSAVRRVGYKKFNARLQFILSNYSEIK